MNGGGITQGPSRDGLEPNLDLLRALKYLGGSSAQVAASGRDAVRLGAG